MQEQGNIALICGWSLGPSMKGLWAQPSIGGRRQLMDISHIHVSLPPPRPKINKNIFLSV